MDSTTPVTAPANSNAYLQLLRTFVAVLSRLGITSWCIAPITVIKLSSLFNCYCRPINIIIWNENYETG